jgi:hypothetical protein
MMTGAGRDVLERRSLSKSSNPQRPPHARRCNYFV